jgi:hypothetical protein
MSERSDISMLANSPTPLQKFSLKMPQIRRAAADLQGYGPPSRNILVIAMRAIFKRSKLPLRIGKRCRKLAVSTAPMSLARLWRDQGKMQQACELLGPVYEWFTEGFDTRGLKDAKAMLEELAA